MPATALQHFREDIARAKAIVAHAELLPHATAAEALLRSDLLRSAWAVQNRVKLAHFGIRN